MKSVKNFFKKQDNWKIKIKKEVLENIKNHAKEDLYNELGGVLLGYYSRTNIHIIDLVKAENIENGPTFIRFTHKTWEGIYQELDKKEDDLKIIGWYHTHPGLGVFLSAMDRFIVENFFNQPYQVSVVIDPSKDKIGFFLYEEGHLRICKEVYEVGES